MQVCLHGTSSSLPNLLCTMATQCVEPVPPELHNVERPSSSYSMDVGGGFFYLLQKSISVWYLVIVAKARFSCSVCKKLLGC